MDKQAKEIMAVLKPEIEKTIQTYADGKLKENLDTISENFLAKAFDKAMIELGKKLNLAPEVIKKMQGFDEMIKEVIDNITSIKKIADDVKNPTEMLILSYKNLQKEKKKSALVWSIASFFLGGFFFMYIFSLFNVPA